MRGQTSSCSGQGKGPQNLSSEFSNPEERAHAQGNDEADKAAKRAAASFYRPSELELENHKHDSSLLRKFLKYLATILPRWPALAPRKGKKVFGKPASTNPPIGAASARHVWGPGDRPPPPPPPPSLPLESLAEGSEAVHNWEYVRSH